MKASIQSVHVVVTVEFNDAEEDQFQDGYSMFRPVSLSISYDSALERGYSWVLVTRRVKNGELWGPERRNNRFAIGPRKALVAKLDRLAESLNPMAALESLKGQEVQGTV